MKFATYNNVALSVVVSAMSLLNMRNFSGRSVLLAFTFGLLFSVIFRNYAYLLQLAQITYATIDAFINPSRITMWSHKRAVNSYRRYEEEALWEPSKMRNSYAKIGLSSARQRISKQLGYLDKLERYRETIRTNGRLAEGIASLGVEEYGDIARANGSEGTDLGRVREAMKHLIRDWSEDGRGEREHVFKLILEELQKVSSEDRRDMNVLVPGSGLGRLAWEISQLGACPLTLLRAFRFTRFSDVLSGRL